MRLATLALSVGCLLHQPLVSQTANKDDAPSALWHAIKEQLSGPNGREYFEKNIKSAQLPALFGTLVSSTPADHPRKFLIAMADDPHPEVTLKLKGSLQNPLPAGTPVRFEGVGMEFTAEPFMLTFQVESVDRAIVPIPSSRKRNNPN
jgi:hypothetical protein